MRCRPTANSSRSGQSRAHQIAISLGVRCAFYPDLTRINHFISLLKTFPFIVIVLRYRAHKSVPSFIVCSIPIQPLVSLLPGLGFLGIVFGWLSHIFLNFSLLLTCWLLLPANSKAKEKKKQIWECGERLL